MKVWNNCHLLSSNQYLPTVTPSDYSTPLYRTLLGRAVHAEVRADAQQREGALLT